MKRPLTALALALFAAPAAHADDGRFEFGSYGRVNAASDLTGRMGRQANIASYGSRLDLDSYAELELRREDKIDAETATRIVTTVALLPPFFHFDGKANDALAVRQLYAQATFDRVTAWAGSRMVRGDDAYLLNWWPLDNQNTIGGGAMYALPRGQGDTTFQLHAGLQRIDDPSTYARMPSLVRAGTGSTMVETLDRPRAIETFKVTHFFRNADGRKVFDDDARGAKVSLYAEAHQIAAGVSKDSNRQDLYAYPSDYGFLVGAQAALWKGVRDTYATVWVRYAHGLATVDPLAAPSVFNLDRRTGDANEALVAFAGNWEEGDYGLLYAGYGRRLRRDPSAATSWENYDEGALVVRPQWWFARKFGASVELSLEHRRYQVLDQAADDVVKANALRVGGQVFATPWGPGSFKRPQLGLTYLATSRDDGARGLYAVDDLFAQRGLTHYAGVFAEWWFNSSSYP
jgi:maltoporin